VFFSSQYGKNKNIMFHDNAFLKKIDQADKSSYFCLDSGHWIQHEQTEKVLSLMTAFFAETKN
jgi:hypothetical protein